MLKSNRDMINQDSLSAISILFLVFISCVFPLTLPAFPQVVALIFILCLWNSKFRYASMKPDLYLLWIFTIPVLGLISATWSVAPHESLLRAIKITGLTLSYSFFLFFIANLSQSAIDYIKRYFYVPLVMSAIYLSIELMFNFPFMHFITQQNDYLPNFLLNKNVAVFMMMLPFGFVSIYKSKHKMIYPVLLTLSVLILIFTDSQASWLAVPVMMIAGVTVYRSPFFLKALIAGISGVFIMMPFIAPFLYRHFAVPMGDGVLRHTSFSARLEIWYFVSAKISERLMAGFGMDATRYLIFDNPALYHPYNTVMHPHNAALQLWNDFGLLGMIAAIIPLLFLLKAILKTDRLSQTLCAVVISSLAIFLLLSWSLWSSWLIGFILFLGMMTFMFTRDPSQAGNI